MSGPFGSTLKGDAYLSSGDIAFIRVQNIKGGFDINDNDLVYISNKDNEKIKSSSLQEGDLILSKVGNSIGYFAKVSSDLGKCNISENNIGIKLSSYSDIEKSFILTYLNAKYANKLVLRRKSGNVQPKINVDDLCRIPILIFPKLSENIHNLIQLHEAYLNQSILSYKQAEDILNKELGITNIENTKNYSVKSFSESFGESNRLDAEYYQDKYDSIKELLDTKENVESLCHIYDNNYIPTNKQKYQYIELSNIGVNGEISGVEFFNGKELPTRARRLVKKNQVIISSVEGSLQSCALITEEYNGALCSNGFFIIDSDCISSETLLILFKSVPIQSLLKQRCSGTILTAISNDELKKIPLPFIKLIVQKEITQKVQESFKLRKDSKNLINEAIRAVEIAIEKNEEYASQWLIENTNEIYHKDKY